MERDDAPIYDFVRHEKTGKVTDHDPRLNPEILRGKSLQFEWFPLIQVLVGTLLSPDVAVYVSVIM